MFGRRETAVMTVVNYIDNIRREIHYYLNWLFSADLRKAMSNNKKIKDTHKGERCFIVGNGPSLKHHDLGKLTDEHVFTVNYMMKSDDFGILNPQYHLFFDPIVFGLNSENEEDNEKIKLIAKTAETNPETTYIIPYRRKFNFDRLFPDHKFMYIYNFKTYTPYLKNPSSLDRITPGFQNVILYAINSAIYLGFKKIYLLGVDMTGFLEHFEYNKINDQWGHSYTKTQEEKEKIIKILAEKKIDNEFYLKTYGKTFEHLKMMHKHAIANNVDLLNASEHGAIDFIQRINYDKLFTKNN